MKKVLLIISGLFILIQIIPYGRDHENPESVTTPEWDSQETKALFERACKDCHSNDTEWPWYSNIAPASWLVQHDVNEGREHFNVSAGPISAHQAMEAVEEIEIGKMPMPIYLPLHPEADLSPEEKQTLINGIKSTFRIGGYSKESTEYESEDHDDHKTRDNHDVRKESEN
ncbi:MAG: cytochrome c [Melioribacteraceae bacterium]|nr:MAG: cytochrome c [Melioribacteraceae bacterium]